MYVHCYNVNVNNVNTCCNMMKENALAGRNNNDNDNTLFKLADCITALSSLHLKIILLVLIHNPVDPLCPVLHLVLVSVIITPHPATPSPAIILQQSLDMEYHSVRVTQAQLLHSALQNLHQAAGGRLVQIHAGYL